MAQYFNKLTCDDVLMEAIESLDNIPILEHQSSIPNPQARLAMRSCRYQPSNLLAILLIMILPLGVAPLLLQQSPVPAMVEGPVTQAGPPIAAHSLTPLSTAMGPEMEHDLGQANQNPSLGFF